jgi:hypothetical protein
MLEARDQALIYMEPLSAANASIRKFRRPREAP